MRSTKRFTKSCRMQMRRVEPRRDHYDFAFWDQVLSHVERELKDDPDLRLTVHLVIKTFDDVANEGDLAIPSTFDRIEDLLPAPTHA